MGLNWRWDAVVGGSNAAFRSKRPERQRRIRLELESLEDRLTPAPAQLTDIIGKAPIIIASPNGSPSPPSTALTPSQIKQAYGINKIVLGGQTGDGAGQTIAIVDAGDNPAFVSSSDPNFINSDLHKFDVQFGIPDPPSFLKLDQNGGTNYPPGPVSNFTGEIALDVEWAHALAPKANIILIEANTAAFSDLVVAAVGAAKAIPQVSVVSMSFGTVGGEPDAATEAALDGVFTTPVGHQGITFLASTGDFGTPGGYPAYSPNVVAVGGTTLTVDAQGNYITEVGWGNGANSGTLGGSGGGLSAHEPQPLYQQGTVTQSKQFRGTPDVSLDADPNTGVAIYDSTDNTDGTGPWLQIGGTSFACPAWAALIAIADQGRAQFNLGTLDGPTQTLPRIYRLPKSDFHDILTGNNGLAAGPGYDLVTGIGTPNAPSLVADLAGVPTGAANKFRAFHTFRYIVHATNPTTSQQFNGNVSIINYTNQPLTTEVFIIIADLPPSVTLDSSVATTTTPQGLVALAVPINGLPSREVVRVNVKFNNPNHISISTFFEGFTLQFGFQG